MFPAGLALAFALACGSGEPPAPPPPALVSDLPQCCLDESSGTLNYRTDLDRPACEALGKGRWMASASCETACCVTADGKTAREPRGTCTTHGAIADDAVCAPGAAVPEVCCVDEERRLDASDPACGPKPGTSYQAADDRRGRGHLVAGGECATACCRSRCDTTGGVEIHLYKERGGACEGAGLCDVETLEASACADVAMGEVKMSFEADPGSDAPPSDALPDEAPATPTAPRAAPRPRPTSEGKPRPR